MAYMFALDRSVPEVLTSVYILLLIVLTFKTEQVSRQKPPETDFNRLLEGFYPVWKEGSDLTDLTASKVGGVEQSLRVSNGRERLRRMSANIGLLLLLVELDEVESASRRDELTSRIRRKSWEVKFSIAFLCFVPSRMWKAPGMRLLLTNVGHSYWWIVRHVHSSYCSPQSKWGDAFATALNLAG